MTWAAMRLPRSTVVRFVVVGGSVTVLNYALLIVMHGWLGWNVTLSAVLALVVAVVVNFVLSRTWTFRATTASPGGQLGRFLALVALNVGFTAVAMTVLTDRGVAFLVAQTLVVAVIVTVNFWLMRTWVFRQPEATVSKSARDVPGFGGTGPS